MTPEPTAATQPEQADSETLRIQSVSPMFTVNDIHASLAWYRDVMAFPVSEEWKTEDGSLMGVSLATASGRLNLTQDDFKKGRERRKGVGFRILLETEQDVDELADAVVSRGATLDTPPTTTPWGARVFAVTDPDGFKISLFNPLSDD